MNASSHTLPATANGRLDKTRNVCGHPHRQIQEHHHEDEREWDHVAEPGLHLREELILTRPLQPCPAGNASCDATMVFASSTQPPRSRWVWSMSANT